MGSRPHALFVVDDAFGEKVADRCGASPQSRMGRDAFGDLDGPRGVDVPIVSIGTNGDAAFRDRLDRLGAAWGVPSVGLELMPTRIVCGPAVIPGRTACHRCYRTRVSQHSGAPVELDEETSSAGLAAGFGPHHVVLAAGLIALALTELSSGPQGLGGTVRTVSLVTGGVSAAPTVAVDRCERCGARFRSGRVAGDIPGLGLVRDREVMA